MEFGRVPEEELNSIDFSLPKEPAANKAVLGGKQYSKPKVYIGCAKWEEQNGLAKSTRQRQRKKISSITMYSITTALN